MTAEDLMLIGAAAVTAPAQLTAETRRFFHRRQHQLPVIRRDCGGQHVGFVLE